MPPTATPGEPFYINYYKPPKKEKTQAELEAEEAAKKKSDNAYPQVGQDILDEIEGMMSSGWSGDNSRYVPTPMDDFGKAKAKTRWG